MEELLHADAVPAVVADAAGVEGAGAAAVEDVDPRLAVAADVAAACVERAAAQDVEAEGGVALDRAGLEGGGGAAGGVPGGPTADAEALLSVVDEFAGLEEGLGAAGEADARAGGAAEDRGARLDDGVVIREEGVGAANGIARLQV